MLIKFKVVLSFSIGIVSFRFIQQIPGGGLWVLPSSRVSPSLLPPHGGDDRVLAGQHQIFPPSFLHLRPHWSLRRKGEADDIWVCAGSRDRYTDFNCHLHSWRNHRWAHNTREKKPQRPTCQRGKWVRHVAFVRLKTSTSTFRNGPTAWKQWIRHG